MTDNAVMMFALGSLDIGWRLAIAVMMGVVGGFYLDKALQTEPLFLIVGSLFSLVLSVVIIKSTVEKINKKMGV